MKSGTLVRPLSITPSFRSGVVFLTPIGNEASKVHLHCPEWKPNEVGIVLPPGPNQLGLLVIIPGGIGLCFHDEVREIQ